MLIWREFLEISSFWREIQLNMERAGETNGEFVSHTILLGGPVEDQNEPYRTLL